LKAAYSNERIDKIKEIQREIDNVKEIMMENIGTAFI
jgi:hypothetical protein